MADHSTGSAPTDAEVHFQSVASARALLLDALVSAGSLVLARWLCLPVLPVTAWEGAWLTLGLALVASQSLAILVLQHRAGPSVLALPVSAGAIVGSGAGLITVWAATGLTHDMWRVSISQVWLFFGIALAWRYASVWQATARMPVTGDLVPPRRPEPVRTIIRRQRTLLRMLVARDLTLKYRGSVLGLLWSLANPLLMTITYGAVFTYVYPSRVEGFAFLMLIGVLAWTFFSLSTRMATSAVVDSGSMVKNVYFPRLVLPSATVIFNFVQLLLALAVLLPAGYLWFGHLPPWTVLLVPVALALTFAFTWGLALVMAATTALFRDVQHLLDVALQVLFWATPIVYTPDVLGPGVAPLLAQSPMAPFITAIRNLAYDGRLPAPPTVALVLLYAAVSVSIGLGVFARLDERFAETL